MNEYKVNKEVVVQESYCFEEEKELTVHKTSMFCQGDGFTVYDSQGDIIFRVHSYGQIKHPLVLLDGTGKPLITLTPKRPTLHQRWEGFTGEKLNHHHHEPPIFSLWKSTMIGRSSIMVEVHCASPTMYQIEGCFSERRCTVFHVSSSLDHSMFKVLVAQIKRKVEPLRNIILGRDVFSLNIKDGFDAAFVMALVLALDRIDGDDVIPMECHKDNIGT